MKKGKKKVIIIIVIITVILLLSAGAILYFLKDDKNKSPDSIKKEYHAIIDAYGDATTLAINNYMDNKNGLIPKWEDIEKNIVFTTHKVSCNNTINIDGSLFLDNCTVQGIDYTDNYKYGKYIAVEETVDGEKTGGEKIYTYKLGDNFWSENIKPNDESNVIDVYECQTNECFYYTKYSDKEIIIYDGKNYIYNFYTHTKKILNIENRKYYNIGVVENDTEPVGLYISIEFGKAAFYNITKEKIVTDYKYNYVTLIENSDNMFYGNIGEYEDSISEVIDINTGEVLAVVENVYQLEYIKLNNNIIYIAEQAMPYNGKITVYDKNFNKILDDNEFYNYATNDDNSITLAGKNSYVIYDGNKITYTSNIYDSVKPVRNYIIIADKDKYLKVITTSEDVKATFLQLNDKYVFHDYPSGWYTENGKNGIYAVVENKDIPYGTYGSGLEYYYIPTTGEVGVIQIIGVGGYAKPVLYLYPQKKTNINVTFEHPEYLTVTYPKYKTEWNVNAYKNGDLYDKDNKYYYGLYWEEEGTTPVDFSEGFYVTKENASEFLESKLDKIGLTRREANEFIMYWLPILEKNEKSLVYFELTAERQQFNKLLINPIPDSLLRVSIHLKKVEKEEKIKEQKLPSFERKGFVAVEWGGVVH